MLQAHLQPIVNGGGRIEREYALGRGRTDLLIVWPQGGRERRYVVECKVLRKDLERTIAEGVEQTRGYMDRRAAEAGHLVVFDRAPDRPWAEKVFRGRVGRRASPHFRTLIGAITGSRSPARCAAPASQAGVRG